ncbi:hypothetical protein [Primorskyibacter sp. S187A]|uniref:hypothetical protein n=1 Tax=Primorskyibacter sp. S187A TaxID=3415130 RepID=UPI003C7BFB06
MSNHHLCISLRRFKVAELRRSLRRSYDLVDDWDEVYLLLGKLERLSRLAFIKSFGSALTALLVFINFENGREVSVQLGEFEVSIRASFLLTFSSLCFFVGAMQLNNWSIFFATKNSYFPRPWQRDFSSNAFSALQEEDVMGMTAPMVLSSFWKPNHPIFSLASIAVTLTVLSLTLPPIAATIWMVMQHAAGISIGSTLSSLDMIAHGIGLLALFTTYLLILAFHFPLPIKKDRQGIRWGVLAPLAKDAGHPMKKKWLREEE